MHRKRFPKGGSRDVDSQISQWCGLMNQMDAGGSHCRTARRPPKLLSRLRF